MNRMRPAMLLETTALKANSMMPNGISALPRNAKPPVASGCVGVRRRSSRDTFHRNLLQTAIR